MELFKAHSQWKSRPSDERFKNVKELHLACAGYRAIAAEATAPFSQLRVEAQNDELVLVGKAGVPAKLTHWAMGQLSLRAGAPAAYLRELPTTLAAQNLNHGLKERGIDDPTTPAKLLFHQNGSLVLRAALSEKYSRIWNSDVTSRLIELQDRNPSWRNPMAYKVLAPGKGGNWPTMSSEMEPAGLYASDHDMFAFLVDESKTLKGSPAGLNRGFFVWNSEVGASSFGVMTFLYDRVCGNNIVWGAKGVTEFRTRHVGQANALAFGELQGQIRTYMDSSASEMEKKIEHAQNFSLGKTKEEVGQAVLKLVSSNRILGLPANKIADAIELAETREDHYGNPYSMWGVVSGLTEASQWEAHADRRVEIDRAAGKLLNTIAF